MNRLTTSPSRTFSEGSMPSWPPIAGYYKTRAIKGGPEVAARIWYGNAIIDGEEQDRGHDWRCEIAGRTDRWERDEATGYRCRVPLHIDRLWPISQAKRIEKHVYDYMLAHAEWAKNTAPASQPTATPHVAVDLSKSQPIF